ncbi:NfeD family protein [Leptolyngbya sp. AN02str]|uniref:NfeD family protein n=1 Tax=Leptolyngbya sp. AN02str TaxID=3423363 RepID=UPI003D318AD4
MQGFSTQPPYILWAIFGFGLIAISLIAFEPIVAALGIAALITAIAALSVPDIAVQTLLWGVLSVTIALVLRGFVPPKSRNLDPPTEAEVSTDIPRGGVGEVSYEGTFWSARCQVSDVAIAAGETVHVVGRQGNTLIVVPASFLQ